MQLKYNNIIIYGGINTNGIDACNHETNIQHFNFKQNIYLRKS